MKKRYIALCLSVILSVVWFGIMPKSKTIVNAQSDGGVQVSVTGYNVTVSGKVSDTDFLSNSMIIELDEKETGKIVYIGGFYCTQTGDYEYTFGLPETAESGTYILKLGMYGEDEGVYEGEVEIEVSKDPAEPVEDIAFSWMKLSEIGTVYPDNCEFYVFVREPQDGDTVIYAIDGVKYDNVTVENKFTYVTPEIKNGKHEISVSVVNGNEVKYSYSESFTVMKKYTPQFMEEFNVRGVATHMPRINVTELETDLLNFAGISNIRDDIKWSRIESTTGFDYNQTDVWLNLVTKNNINLKGILGFNNIKVDPLFHHATGEKITGESYIPRKQTNIERFIAYVDSVVNKYPGFDDFELWNEPNGDSTLTATDYTDLAINTAVTLNKNNRFANLGVMSLMDYREKLWVQENFASGIYPYMTELTFHPYSLGSVDEGGQEKECENVYNAIVDNGGWKKMNITEVGWSTYNNGSTEEDAAINLVKQSVLTEKYDVSGNYWYDFINDGTNINDREHFFGIVDSSRKPKLAYIAYGQLNEKLAGALYMGEVSLGNNIRAIVYEKNGEPLMVAWTAEDSTTYTFENEVEAEDIYANIVSDNASVINIGNSPVYITGLNKAWFETAVRTELNKEKVRWEEKYSDEISENSGSLVSSALSYDLTNISCDGLQQLQETYKNAGLAIIEDAENGLISDKKASSALYELYRNLRLVNRLYITKYAGDNVTELKSNINEAIELSNERYYNDFYMMPYSEEILRLAKEYYDKAESVLNSSKINPVKNGVISGWDKMSGILIEWFSAFSGFEDKFNYGLFVNIGVDTNSYMDTAETGTEKNMGVYVVNKGLSDFSGYLKIYDEGGDCIYSSKELSIPKDSNKLQISAFMIDENVGKNTYTIMLEDNDGNIGMQRNFELLVYSGDESGYPDHTGQGNYSSNSLPMNNDLTHKAREHSDENRIFDVDGRKFVLLDKDENGNYFVAADEVYGQKAFNLNAESDSNTEELKQSGKWVYNPDNSNNIGNWLNGWFLWFGNGGIKLPNKIINNMIESTWAVESSEAAGVEVYSVKSKVSLMSATEWLHYADILGYAPSNAPYAYPDANGNNTYTNEKGIKENHGWWLRTPIETGPVYGCFVTVYRHSGFPGLLAPWSVRSKNQQRYVRPVFWLSADFFEKNEIDLSLAGSDVISEIAEGDLNKLKNIYSEDELISLNKVLIGVDLQNNKYSILSPKAETAGVYVAEYGSDENGLLNVRIDANAIVKGYKEYPINISDAATSAKIFLWDEELRPLTNATEILRKE